MPADISFASFNLYNFQKAGEATYRNNIVSSAEYNAKRKWIAAKIKDIDADVIACQELWNKECLDEALSDLPQYKAHYIGDTWYNTAVAIIVKQPWEVINKTVIKHLPFTEMIKAETDDGEDDEVSVSINKFSRSVLKLTIENSIEPNTPAIKVFGCHLKSKLPTTSQNPDFGSALSTIRRTAEANGLRMLLDKEMEGEQTPTVVLGDLNDDPLSNTLSLITKQPTMTKRSRGSDKALYNALFLEQLKSFRDVFYTHRHNNHLGVLDHVLVSEEFFEHSTDAIWEHKRTQIWNDHVEDDKGITTDHGIIKASFK